MKFKKAFFNYILYYVLGNVCFNAIFSITKTILINMLGAQEILLENFLSSFRETFIFYTFLFILILLANIIYKKYMINQLNQRLNKVKEGSDNYEK